MYLDLIIFAIILIAILSGVKNGIFVEIISVFGLVINVIVAKIYTPVILKFFKRTENTFGNNYIITYIVTFIAVYLVISMILLFVKKSLKKQRIEFFNRFLGGVLGFIKGTIAALIVLLVYSYSTNLIPTLEKYSIGSKTIVIFYEVMPNLEEYIPDILIEKFNKNATLKMIEKKLNTIL